MVPTATEALDGRRLRGQRSRAAVATAALDLICEGNLLPTAADIAARADVSLRSVFHHFDDMDSLYQTVFRMQSEELAPLLTDRVTAALPIAQRIPEFVRQRAAYLDGMLQVFRAAQLVATTSPAIADHLQASCAVLRNQVTSLFEGDLACFRPAERRERLIAMQAATTFSAWETLRVEMDLDAETARNVLKRELRCQLAPTSPR
ncbi:MAG: TetR/AcrR family transcriptional regulator [Polyangiaceae bacterium]|nr:TetR/AcrR family transcriptional regulator [Polyangiaceae bacterium]